MAFKAGLNFSGKYHYGLNLKGVLVCYFFFLLLGCQSGQPEKSHEQVSTTTTDPVNVKAEEFFPPESFILSLKSAATTIISVKITEVDSVMGATKVFSGTILKSYKGGLLKGSNIQYAGMSEKKYKNNSLDTVVVFLTKHQQPLSDLKRKDVYYSTVEENAMIEPYSKLDSLLKP